MFYAGALALSIIFLHGAQARDGKSHGSSADGLQKTATYYTPDGGNGACGPTIQNEDMAVALGYAEYGNVADGTNCNKTIGVTYNGQSIEVTVLDLCTGCEVGHIDLTQGAFTSLGADISLGVIDIEYDYVSGNSSSVLPSSSSTPTPTSVSLKHFQHENDGATVAPAPSKRLVRRTDGTLINM